MAQALGVTRPTALIVEDEALLRFTMADLLEEHGFCVIEATDADEAITLLEAHPEITTIVTDIDMPGSMDGVMLTQHVRRRWPPVTMVVVSGRGLSGRGELPLGVGFLTKPVDSGALFRLIGDPMRAA